MPQLSTTGSDSRTPRRPGLPDHPRRCARRGPGAGMLLTAALLASACGEGAGDAPGAAGGDAAYGGTVVLAAPSDLQAANPLVAREAFTQEVNRHLLFTPLLRFTPELQYAPYLAERWDLLGDTGVVFHLRRDVRWHDGTPTTAEDVVFTLERVLDPATGFGNPAHFSGWRAVQALDSFTVRASFDPMLEPLLGLPQLGIVPRHLLGDVPPEQLANADFNVNPVGNGPFRFVSRQANDRWVFEANPDFPEELGGRPFIDRLVWRVLPDETARAAELRAGAVDMLIGVNAESYAALDTLPGIQGIQREGGRYTFIGWNGKLPFLGDPRVRRGLTMAIDRQEMIDLVRRGEAESAAGPVLPSHWGHHPELQPLPFDPDSATALLAVADIRNRDGDPWLEEPSGEEFEIELKIPSGVESNRVIAQLIHSDFQDIGIRVEIRSVDPSTFFEDISSPERTFEAAVVGWQAGLDLNLRDPYHSDALGERFQLASYSNPAVDSLLDAMEAARTREEAIPLLRRVQEILREDQPWTYLYYYPDLYLARERLQGVEMDVRGVFVNVSDWWVEASTS